MELIDKDALLAKIIKRRDAALTRQHNLKSIGQESVLNEMIANELNLIISLINTLEVKEVDFEEYYHKFLQEEWFGNSHVRTVSEMMAFTAKHFFGLGMQVSNKAQKGE